LVIHLNWNVFVFLCCLTIDVGRSMSVICYHTYIASSSTYFIIVRCDSSINLVLGVL
jgi:hypothetical protein